MIGMLAIAAALCSLAGCARTVFKQDFSRYRLGDPLPDWGESACVLVAKDGRNCISTQEPGEHVVTHNVDFPENFSFQMEFIGKNLRGWESTEGTNPTFIDSAGKEFQVILHGNGPAFQLPGKTYYVPEAWNTAGIFRLEKKGPRYVIYWNDAFIQFGDYPDYSCFVAFKFTIRPRDYITNIIIKDIGK
jgi:hypothetical protein